jgi:hypothetical protein
MSDFVKDCIAERLCKCERPLFLDGFDDELFALMERQLPPFGVRDIINLAHLVSASNVLLIQDRDCSAS